MAGAECGTVEPHPGIATRIDKRTDHKPAGHTPCRFCMPKNPVPQTLTDRSAYTAAWPGRQGRGACGAAGA